jgi:hypothetical protein
VSRGVQAKVAIAAIVALFTVGTAAAAPEPLPIVGIDPQPQGAVVSSAATTPNPSFEIRLTVPEGSRYGSLVAEVSDRNVPGQDGTLADDYIAGYGLLFQSDADPTVWRGTIIGGYKARPGTYYLQFSGTRSLSAPPYEGTCWPFGCLGISPVYAFQVVAPPPAPAPPTPAPAAPSPAVAPAVAAPEQSPRCIALRGQLRQVQRKVRLARNVVDRAATRAARVRAVTKLRAAAVARNRVQAAMWGACG